MPRVHTKKAAKDYPAQGIRKGDLYYSWQFKNGPVIKSATYPRPSQLTSSSFLQTFYGLQEQWEALTETQVLEDDALQNLIDELQSLRDETQDRRDAMPESLQEVGSGELLGERVDGLDALIQELEDKQGEVQSWQDEEDDPEVEESEEPGEGDTKAERGTSLWEDIQSAVDWGSIS